MTRTLHTFRRTILTVVVAAVAFPSSAGTPGSLALERYTGTYTGGSFGGTFRITFPTQQQ